MESAVSGPSIPVSEHTRGSLSASTVEPYEQTEEQTRETQMLVQLLPRSLRDSLLSHPEISQVNLTLYTFRKAAHLHRS